MREKPYQPEAAPSSAKRLSDSPRFWYLLAYVALALAAALLAAKLHMHSMLWLLLVLVAGVASIAAYLRGAAFEPRRETLVIPAPLFFATAAAVACFGISARWAGGNHWLTWAFVVLCGVFLYACVQYSKT